MEYDRRTNRNNCVGSVSDRRWTDVISIRIGRPLNMDLSIKVAEIFQPLLSPSRYKGAHGGRGSGKCLALCTKVIMYDGSLRSVEDVCVDDKLMGPDSLPRLVLGTTRGRGKLYRVSQRSGGEDYIVNEDHILSLRRSSKRYGSWDDILDVPVKDILSQSKKWRKSFKGYKSGLVKFKRKNLEIPPYVFGVWIGDGFKSRPGITSMDEEIISEFSRWGESVGCVVKRVKKEEKSKAWRVGIWNDFLGRVPNPAKEILRELGVLNNKHVPHDYKTSSLKDRLEFLAGIIDTDGHVTNQGRSITINQQGKNSHLIDAIGDLCGSLGFSCNITYSCPNFTSANHSEPFEKATIFISGGLEEIPTILPRKKCLPIMNKGKDSRGRNCADKLRTSIKVEKSEETEYYGFEVDGTGRFLLSDFTLAHNCNNQQFLNSNHWMNLLKEWEGVEIADAVVTCENEGEFFVFVPYVSPGRFEEALDTIGDLWKRASCIFAHQEFYGCKMGAITSLDGDKWPEKYPRVVSGHIHSSDHLQGNLYYTGSAMQHAFGESEKNTVAVLDLEMGQYQCREVDLELPRKKIIATTFKKVMEFEIPQGMDKLMLSISGINPEEFKSFQKSKKYKELQKAGIKVKFNQQRSELIKEVDKEAATKGSNFREILYALVQKEKNSYLTSAYELLINEKVVKEEDIIYL